MCEVLDSRGSSVQCLSELNQLTLENDREEISQGENTKKKYENEIINMNSDDYYYQGRSSENEKEINPNIRCV